MDDVLVNGGRRTAFLDKVGPCRFRSFQDTLHFCDTKGGGNCDCKMRTMNTNTPKLRGKFASHPHMLKCHAPPHCPLPAPRPVFFVSVETRSAAPNRRLRLHLQGDSYGPGYCDLPEQEDGTAPPRGFLRTWILRSTKNCIKTVTGKIWTEPPFRVNER